jgi:hypothetical protein
LIVVVIVQSSKCVFFGQIFLASQPSKHVFIFMLEFLFYSVPWSVYSLRDSNQPKKLKNCNTCNITWPHSWIWFHWKEDDGTVWANICSDFTKTKMTEMNSGLKRWFPWTYKWLIQTGSTFVCVAMQQPCHQAFKCKIEKENNKEVH